MAHPVHGVAGGIRSLLIELREHGEAITYDLMSRGWTRSDIGVRFTWRELYHFLRWIPPVAESAYFRAKKPNSWWVTPELQMMAGVLYAVEGANWQRGGCQGNQPKPVKFPSDKDLGVKDVEDLMSRREAMRRRRESGSG